MRLKRAIAASVGSLFVSTLALVLVACGGGSGDSNDTAVTPARTVLNATGTVPTASVNSASAEAAVASVPPATSPAAHGTVSAGASTPSSSDATLIAGAGGDIAGGDPSSSRQEVGGGSTPPSGATIDSTVVAPPQPDAAGLQLIIDADATTPGIQPSRTVSTGDVFRVAVVLVDAADGVSAFNFFVDYDRRLAIAPSYAGGSTTDRNPDLDEGTMGGEWSCLPAPEGDIDDEGGINGDGDPATGRALLSCFNVTFGATGDLVLGVIEFRAVSAGSLPLSLNSVALGNSVGAPIGQCAGGGAPGDPELPCTGATITIE